MFFSTTANFSTKVRSHQLRVVKGKGVYHEDIQKARKEFDADMPSGEEVQQISSQPAAVIGDKKYPSAVELMGFSGVGPETINGRLAMLGVIAALGAELAKNVSLQQQFTLQPTPILLTFALVAVGSLHTFSYGEEKTPFGPFTPQAEMLNGRAAMIGFASLLIIEVIKGSALF